MRPLPHDLHRYQDATVGDLVGDAPVRLVFVGINPSLMTAATGTHFAHPSNRFYPALHRAGLTTRPLPRGTTHPAEVVAELTGRGIAITNLVERATARASDLTTSELRAGAVALTEKVARWAPEVVAIVGVTAYRTAFERRDARLGRQARDLCGAALWVLPNPSGLNAHESVESLAAWYRRVGVAAGIV